MYTAFPSRLTHVPEKKHTIELAILVRTASNLKSVGRTMVGIRNMSASQLIVTELLGNFAFERRSRHHGFRQKSDQMAICMMHSNFVSRFIHASFIIRNKS